MATSPDPRHEYQNTYIVQDRSNQEEMQRLHLQDRMITDSMGGLLPEQADPTRFQRVLDVGCGTGGWLIEMAKAYPQLTRLVGVDASGTMLDFARSQAEAEGVGERVEFYKMDALLLLEFPDASFDLINQRFGVSYLRSWDWPKLLQEYLRIAQPGGVIRVTEDDVPTQSSSPSFLQLGELGTQTLYRAGHFFHPAGDGIIRELARLLTEHGVQNVQARAYALEYRAGTPEGQLFIADMQHLLRNMKPFMQKWAHLPDNYEELYQQMIRDMNAPDFTATWNLLTVWGNKP